jgi:hypothetical protein
MKFTYLGGERAVVEFKLSTLHLLGRHCTTEAIPSAPFVFVIFQIGSHFMPGKISTYYTAIVMYIII